MWQTLPLATTEQPPRGRWDGIPACKTGCHAYTTRHSTCVPPGVRGPDERCTLPTAVGGPGRHGGPAARNGRKAGGRRRCQWTARTKAAVADKSQILLMCHVWQPRIHSSRSTTTVGLWGAQAPTHAGDKAANNHPLSSFVPSRNVLSAVSGWATMHVVLPPHTAELGGVLTVLHPNLRNRSDQVPINS